MTRSTEDGCSRGGKGRDVCGDGGMVGQLFKAVVVNVSNLINTLKLRRWAPCALLRSSTTLAWHFIRSNI